MNNWLSIFSVIIALSVSTCKTGKINNVVLTGYDFASPDESVTLPSILHEISGITHVDSSLFACIQDEKGILFFYDLAKNDISNQMEFFIKGDYEGITRVEDTIYVLRSDGTLFEIPDYKSGSAIATPYPTEIPCKNNEGLCYDSKNRRLLIACKENTGKGDLSKDERYIFAFDLRSKRLVKEPVFSIDVSSLKDFAIKHQVDLPLKGKKKSSSSEPVFKYHPSAIGIHPLTGRLYLLSADDYLLFIFDMNGKIEHMVKLNPLLFLQSEGIAFFDNGDMVISNEGQPKIPANLQRINYHPEKIRP
jgi:uncharacterized protein YjiK